MVLAGVWFALWAMLWGTYTWLLICDQPTAFRKGAFTLITATHAGAFLFWFWFVFDHIHQI
jgi:hypothetical protein